MVRNMWRTQPQSLVDFSHEVVNHGNEQYFRCLANPAIYSLMKNWMQTHDSSFINSLVEGNAYQRAIELSQTQQHSERAPQLIQELPLAEPTGRIAVWSETHSNASRASVRANCEGAEILFYGMDKRARHMPTEIDAVIWVTTGSDHSAYYSIKHKCNARGIPFYHVNQPGVDALVTQIHNHAYLSLQK